MPRGTRRAACCGGPLDGLEVTASGAFCWFNEAGRVFPSPGEDRWLYQWRDLAWWYVGDKAHRCEGCKAIVFVKRESCPHCGATP